MNIVRNLLSKVFGRNTEGANDSISNPADGGYQSATTQQPVLNLADVTAEWLIVGLGNPGQKYAATRHNVGYMVVDDLLAESGETLQPIKDVQAFGATIEAGEETALVLRTASFMNNSGPAIADVAQRLGIPAERVLLIHDELDLKEHKIRLKQGGNEAGHNGLKSTTEHLGTRDYPRVRMGVGHPGKGNDIIAWVLGPVPAGAGFDEFIATGAEAARLIVAKGLGAAQNEIHSR
ncbi:aminoacyl-tRNA hydrolase [Corynebacterium sp. MSK297]|uniref:aminoacyl-tRNA hydrolase n=1 Tax=Corynebacterium sp. MSK297 TaxID=3050221 RepID=UPI00254ADDA7|nr:aminoacyl-tRNA hydrolase [Corynebacterium sp. MSK297]MDK8845914.1 aminoacyl-tRNA hydrolase [Corynebacterium sp. MSK297]